MMLCLWSVKGGSGCTVTAAAIGLLAAEEGDTLLVDLTGDLALALGDTASEAPASDAAGLGWGVAGWLSAPHPPGDALKRLERPITPRLSLLPLGQPARAADDGEGHGMPGTAPPGEQTGRGGAGPDWPAAPADRLALLARLLARDGRTVVVDLGLGTAPAHQAACGLPPAWSGSAIHPFLDAATSSLLVTRPCYLSLHRAARSRQPDGIVLVDEPGRVLRPADVAGALTVPVVAFVPWEAAVSRAVDAGLIAQRVPRALQSLWSVIPAATGVAGR
ncbi:MAG: hypothetical protein R2761_07095 [Acidimicrobiales bacterium]